MTHPFPLEASCEFQVNWVGGETQVNPLAPGLPSQGGD